MAIDGKDFRSTQLLILAFDHRGTFVEKMLGVKGRRPTQEESSMVSEYKDIIYDGFLQALEKGVPKEVAGILCDEEFGSRVLSDARRKGIAFAVPAEKSGQDEFDFEHGNEFRKAIERIQPTFCKVLVRYNPEGDSEVNRRQVTRLKQLSDYLSERKTGFLFELLVPPTVKQLESVDGNKHAYDAKSRPRLMVQAMNDFQDAGIEPDLWKLEGVENASDAAMLVAQAQAGGRNAGVITLGRGESAEKVREWLEVGARVKGIVGFAVGRTIFWDALTGYREGKLSRKQAVDAICARYMTFVKVWQESRKEYSS